MNLKRCFLLAATMVSTSCSSVHAQRVMEGVIALYEFNEGSGTAVLDTSNSGDPLNLVIDEIDLDDELIVWGDGFVSINRDTNEFKEDGTIAPIQSEDPATKIYDAIVDVTDAFTVEAWVVPERDGSPGRDLTSNPARIVSMSDNHSFRNFTLGQQEPGDRWVTRVRNSEAGRNGTCCGIGQMETPFDSITAETLTHVVLTRDADGVESLYYNQAGDAFGNVVSREVPGTLIDGGGGMTAGGNPGATDWHPDYFLALGDEANVAERKWAGDFHLVAIYDQALTVDQVKQNFDAGPEVTVLLGDFNGNGDLDVSDVNVLSMEVASGQNNSPFDLNSDDKVDPEDLTVWVNDLKATWIGDANLDGEFNSGDFVGVFTAGKYETGEAASWESGDWNADLRFDSGDFVAAFSQGGYELGPRVTLVPEPTAMKAIASLLLSVLLVRRRRRPCNLLRST